MLPEKVYNVLKYVVIVVIPAIIFFLNTIAPALSWGDIGPVNVVLGAVGTLLGTLIGVSSSKFNKTHDYIPKE